VKSASTRMPPIADLLPETPAAWRELSPAARGAIARAAWLVLVVAALVAAGGLGRAVRHEYQALSRAQAALDVQAGAGAGARRTVTGSASAPEVAADFTSELPAVAPTDQQMRFAARLAEEQHVVLGQMQYEAMHMEGAGLGRTRVLLQLRGDYRDVKSLVIALLHKYPGLTLERLTLRHAGGPGTERPDEANVELVQYLRPRTPAGVAVS